MRFLPYGVRWIGLIAPFVLAAVFPASVVLKIEGFERFERLTSTFSFIPSFADTWFAAAVILAELAAACFLIAPASRTLGLYATLILLVGFTGFLIVQLFNPYMPSCECFGEFVLSHDAATASRLNVVRNALLLGLCAAGIWSRGGPAV